MLITRLKTQLRGVLPARAFFVLRSLWHRLARTPHVALAQQFADRAGLEVRTGPFAGMRYLEVGSGSSLIPKLVGTYERELHEELESLLADGPSRVVNVGCGEGYYAVGIAQRLPGAHVVAADTAPSARALCESLASANGVADRVEVIGECTVHDLDRLTGPGSLVIIDCEGCEVDLLRPDRAPGLVHADLIVELHDFIRPGTTATLIERLSPTHDVRLIGVEPRDPSQVSALEVLEPADRHAALAENRPRNMQWAICRARRPPA